MLTFCCWFSFMWTISLLDVLIYSGYRYRILNAVLKCIFKIKFFCKIFLNRHSVHETSDDVIVFIKIILNDYECLIGKDLEGIGCGLIRAIIPNWTWGRPEVWTGFEHGTWRIKYFSQKFYSLRWWLATDQKKHYTALLAPFCAQSHEEEIRLLSLPKCRYIKCMLRVLGLHTYRSWVT
jgi:hypothetical protein